MAAVRRPVLKSNFDALTGRDPAREEMNPTLHRSWLTAVAALAIASPTALGGVSSITVDPETELCGNFQLFGFGSADGYPTLFAALPAGADTLRVVRDFGNAFAFTTATGLSDNPQINGFTSQGPFFASGRYDNGGPSQDISVDWSLQFVNYNPSSNDHMEGRFSFTLVAVPEPAETAAAVGAALVAIAAVRRSRRTGLGRGAVPWGRCRPR